jgi:hypothetical protein
MWRRIREIFFVFFLIFSFSVFGFSLTYGVYQYQPSFYEKVKNMAFWVIENSKTNFYSQNDSLIPFRVKVGYTWDTILVYFKVSSFSSIYSYSTSRTYSDDCSGYRSYTFFVNATMFLPPSWQDVQAYDGDRAQLYCSAGNWIPYRPGSSVYWNTFLSLYYASSTNVCVKNSGYCFPCGTFLYSISGAVSIPASSHRMYCVF